MLVRVVSKLPRTTIQNHTSYTDIQFSKKYVSLFGITEVGNAMQMKVECVTTHH
jgi:hypothetical protein